MKTIKKSFPVFLCFCVGIFISTGSRVQFIIPQNPVSLQPTPKQVQMKSREEKDRNFSEGQFVKMGTLPDLQKNGVPGFSISGRSGLIKTKSTVAKRFSKNKYEWYGSIGDVERNPVVHPLIVRGDRGINIMNMKTQNYQLPRDHSPPLLQRTFDLCCH